MGRPRSQHGAVCRQGTEHVGLCVMQPIQQNVVWCRRRVRRCGAPAHPRTAADTLLAAVMATAGQHRHDACSTTDLTRAGRWRVQGRPDDTTCMQQHGSATPCTAVASTAGQRPDSACAALHGNSHHTRQRSQHSLCSIIALPKDQDVLLHLPVPLAVQDLRHAGPQLATAAAQQTCICRSWPSCPGKRQH